MSGTDVKAPQELLLQLGYVLPKYRDKPSIAPGFRLSFYAQSFKYRILRAVIENQIETADQIWRYRAKIDRRGYRQQYLLRTASGAIMSGCA